VNRTVRFIPVTLLAKVDGCLLFRVSFRVGLAHFRGRARPERLPAVRTAVVTESPLFSGRWPGFPAHTSITLGGNVIKGTQRTLFGRGDGMGLKVRLEGVAEISMPQVLDHNGTYAVFEGVSSMCWDERNKFGLSFRIYDLPSNFATHILTGRSIDQH
jgi:hypothetical protein